jgi:hypothetical protein
MCVVNSEDACAAMAVKSHIGAAPLAVIFFTQRRVSGKLIRPEAGGMVPLSRNRS